MEPGIVNCESYCFVRTNLDVFVDYSKGLILAGLRGNISSGLRE